MMRWLIVLLAASGCTRGDFCAIYEPVDLSRDGALAVVSADRVGAERIAVNEESYDGCGL